MAFEYKFGKKKSDALESIISQERLEKIKKHTREQGWFPEFTLEKQVEELTKQLEEKDEMILHDCERINGLKQQIEMLQCLIETKDKVIAKLKEEISLHDNLIRSMQDEFLCITNANIRKAKAEYQTTGKVNEEYISGVEETKPEDRLN